MAFRIVVPVKQVPDIEKVKFDFETGRVDRSSAPGETNPFDLNALEAGVRIKEELGGEVIVISMGPRQAESTLRDCIARGADRGILLTDQKFAGSDTLATSYTIACAIRKIGGFSLIICGEKTVDGDTGQVGPEIAEHLGIPHVSYVSKILSVNRREMRVEADLGPAYYTFRVRLPALITVTKDINTPRLPTLKDKLRAKRARIETWSASYLGDVCDPRRFGTAGSPTVVRKVYIPPERGRKCVFLEGDDAIERLADLIAKIAGV